MSFRDIRDTLIALDGLGRMKFDDAGFQIELRPIFGLEAEDSTALAQELNEVIAPVVNKYIGIVTDKLKTKLKDEQLCEGEK